MYLYKKYTFFEYDKHEPIIRFTLYLIGRTVLMYLFENNVREWLIINWQFSNNCFSFNDKLLSKLSVSKFLINIYVLVSLIAQKFSLSENVHEIS